jgi:hypothetical protein
MTNTSNNAHRLQRPTRRAAIQAMAKITKILAYENQLPEIKKAKKKATRRCHCRYAFSIMNTKSKL